MHRRTIARLITANGYLGLLVLIAAVVRHWSVLLLFFGLLSLALAGGFLGAGGYRYWGDLGFSAFMSWVVLAGTFLLFSGMWWPIGMVAIAFGTENYHILKWQPPGKLVLTAEDEKDRRRMLTAALGMFAAVALLLAGYTLSYDITHSTDHSGDTIAFTALTLVLSAMAIASYWWKRTKVTPPSH
jgi:hypothetical protein